LSTLVGLVDDEWVRGEIKACVLQMGLVAREAWAGMWYCEDSGNGGNEEDQGGNREKDKENMRDASRAGSRFTRSKVEVEARVLRVREEGVVYVQGDADPRSPMPVARARTPMAQRAGPTSPTKAGSTSPKKRFHVFTDKLQLCRQ
jgi:hypothetical protein